MVNDPHDGVEAVAVGKVEGESGFTVQRRTLRRRNKESPLRDIGRVLANEVIDRLELDGQENAVAR